MCFSLIAVFNDIAAWEMFDKCGPNSAVSTLSYTLFFVQWLVKEGLVCILVWLCQTKMQQFLNIVL